MKVPSTVRTCQVSAVRSGITRVSRAIFGAVMLMLALTACIGPVKPAPTQQSQEASPPPTETADASKPVEPALSEPPPLEPEAPVVPLPPIGSSQSLGPPTQDEIPVIETKPVFVTAQRESYAVDSAFTATKTDTPLMEAPVAVQVVPRQVMQDQRANRLQDVLQNVSGVRSNNNNLEGYVYKLRGFTSLDVYRNGLRVPGGSSQPTITESANLERVEVLKGPASVLFARAEPGGLINLVTKRPLATPYYKLEQEFGSYDHYRTVWDATGPLNDSGTVGYRLSGSFQQYNSFKDLGWSAGVSRTGPGLQADRPNRPGHRPAISEKRCAERYDLPGSRQSPGADSPPPVLPGSERSPRLDGQFQLGLRPHSSIQSKLVDHQPISVQ